MPYQNINNFPKKPTTTRIDTCTCYALKLADNTKRFKSRKMNNSRNLLENPLEGTEDKSIFRKSVSYPIEEKKGTKNHGIFSPSSFLISVLEKVVTYTVIVIINTKYCEYFFFPSPDSSLFLRFSFFLFFFFSFGRRNDLIMLTQKENSFLFLFFFFLTLRIFWFIIRGTCGDFCGRKT